MTTMAPALDRGVETGRDTVLDYLRERSPGLRLPPVEVLGLTDAAELAPPVAGEPVPILLTSGSAMLGPLPGVPGAPSPCRLCLALRWQRLRSTAERDVLEGGGRLDSLTPSPYLTTFALEAIRQLWTLLQAAAHDPEARPGIASVYDLNLRTLQVVRVELLIDSECPSCALRGVDGPAELSLVNRPKRRPGDYRDRPLREYELPVLALTNPACGMLGNKTVLDYTSSTTSPSVGMFRCRNARGLHDVMWTGQTDSFETSKTSGLFEGLERYAGMIQRRHTEPVTGSLDEFGADALDPRDCGVYTDELYEASKDFEAFDPAKPIPWIWGYSLRDRRPLLVPQRTAFYGGADHVDNFVHECSNGCAGGASLEEAILHGMLELIERDSFVLAWYGKAGVPEIDPDSCTSGSTRSMIDRLRLGGYDVRLFDCRIDFPVPAVIAVAVRRDDGPGALCFAAGASLDPEAAVASALAEVASYVPTMPGRVTERQAEVEAMALDYDKVKALADHAALFALPEMTPTADFWLSPRPRHSMTELYADWERTRPRTTDLLADVEYCRDLLIDAGFDVIVVEQTSPEQEALGLEAACVIVPGLLPIDFGWRLQRALVMPRTRTAFRRAGWRETDLDESELCQVPHPFP